VYEAPLTPEGLFWHSYMMRRQKRCVRMNMEGDKKGAGHDAVQEIIRQYEDATDKN